jgi:hypothetical protein
MLSTESTRKPIVASSMRAMTIRCSGPNSRRLVALGRRHGLQQGGEVDHRNLTAAKIDTPQAQRAVQHGRLQFRHADDFLDRRHLERERRAADAEADTLAPRALVAAGVAPGRALQRQHLRHVFNPHQRGRIEHLQQTRAAVE